MWCCLFLGLSFIVRQESAGRNAKLSQLGQFNGIRSRSGAQLTQQYPRQYRISTNIMRPRDFTPRSYRGSVKFSTLSPYGVAISKLWRRDQQDQIARRGAPKRCNGSSLVQ